MSSNNVDKYKAPALEKGLAIIEYLALQPSAQSQSEIAIGLEKSPNEIYRMLASLETRGYIQRDPISLKYSLTLKLYYLSHRHSLVEKLRSAALQPMRQTSSVIAQPCHLSVLFNDKVLVVAYSKSPRPIAVMIEEGNLYNILTTASGKTLLSFLEDNSREQVLLQDPGYQKLSKGQKRDFQKELAHIKKQGYTEMPSSYAQGIIDFSVPIGHTSSGITACLTVSKLLTLEDQNEPLHEEIIQKLLACKKEIEGNLGLASLPKV
ncbi:IclR family transcriptional regulator [Sphingobacterium corticibacterium]|uniref:IclR family transcriptional regulator n=1 Tax=Sphingobacterium corticibacterium TaxID=2484746 RepID=A0A4Q6XIZ6_9SPHI|nr:IclR family transcriptional regulator [Sphingobacterium corticibacterium]RZF59851.1 IclR family transcriptional regulator [Sphingobacterium corticibacterium]